MRVPVFILPDADAEALDIFAAYYSIQPSLARRFLQTFQDSLASIQESPEAFSKVFKHSRRVRMKKFPYHVYYSIKPQHQRIVIWAVFHVSRDITKLHRRENII